MRRSLVFALLVILLFRIGDHFFRPHLQLKKGDWILVKSCLDSQPRLSGGRQVFYLAGIKIITSAKKHYFFGDCLAIKGKLNARLFLDEPQIESWQSSSWQKVKKASFLVREKMLAIYRRWLPEPEASLVAGIVLGAKSKLPQDFYEKMRRTGVLHVAVASGYNLTVISQRPTDTVAWFVGRRMALVLGWILVWGYVLIVGAEPPVVRAAVTVSLVYLAQFLGKKFDVWRALAVTIWLMLVIQPGLLTSISFQLSAGAMAGLLLFEEKWQRLRKIPLIGQSLAESLSAQIMVLPIIAYHFGEITWVSPLINMIILPLVPPLMIFGLLGLVAMPFLYLGYPLVWFAVWVIEQVERWL